MSKESLFYSRGIVHQQGNDCGAVDLAQEDSESLGPGGTGLCRSGVGWPDGGNSATARRRRVPRSNQQEGQEDRADPGADAGTPGRGQEGCLDEAELPVLAGFEACGADYLVTGGRERRHPTPKGITPRRALELLLGEFK